jgi:hypothetical protein
MRDKREREKNAVLSALYCAVILGGAIVAPVAAEQPAEQGQTLNGFQDDFTGPSRDPNWVVVGPGGDHYLQSGAVLKVFASGGDANHLLYMAPGASNIVQQEVLARIRVVNFGTGDGPRGGICVGVETNVVLASLDAWSGIDLLFRDNIEDSPPNRHFKLRDDLRAWGPQTTFGWTNNVWYWLRLRMYPFGNNPNDYLAKAWAADGATSEPGEWQLQWADSAVPRPIHGGWAGITASSSNGLSQFEVSYILIKSDSLPSIQVRIPTNPPPLQPPFFISITQSATNVTVSWFGPGTLQVANPVSGPWADVLSATSPYVSPVSKEAQFYRVYWPGN